MRQQRVVLRDFGSRVSLHLMLSQHTTDTHTYKREGSLKCNTGSTGRGRFPHFNGPFFFFFFAGDYTHATARGQSSVIKRRYTTMAIRRSVIYYLAALLGERSRLRNTWLIKYRVLLALCHPTINHFVLL